MTAFVLSTVMMPSLTETVNVPLPGVEKESVFPTGILYEAGSYIGSGIKDRRLDTFESNKETFFMQVILPRLLVAGVLCA